MLTFAAMRYRVGEHVLDLRKFELRKDGCPVPAEPQVLSLLFHLVENRDRLVSKDELVDAIWGGRAISDSAISSRIKSARQLLDDDGEAQRLIRTVHGKGFRFVGEAQIEDETSAPLAVTVPDNEAPAPRSPSRRSVVLGAATAGILAAAGGGVYLYGRITRPLPPEVSALLARASLARDFTRESQNEAIALYRRVTEIAPYYADGWGLLALAYATPSHYRERAEAEVLRQRSAAASRRAFELDPTNGYAELASAAALPFIGHWTERERHLRRALSVRPDDPDVLAAAAVLAQSTGHFERAVKLFASIRPKPLRPSVHNNYARSLWSAGRLDEADRAIDEGLSLYPNYGGLWFTRYDMLVMDGRPKAALAMTEDADGLPTGLTQPEIDRLSAIARAADSANPAAARAIVAAQVQKAHEATGPAEDAIRTAAMLGQVDDAFAVASAYYFGRGFFVPDVRFSREDGFYSPPEQRQIHFLFEPLTRSMRADSRFAPLLKDIGLERYWHDTGVQPDFRRA